MHEQPLQLSVHALPLPQVPADQRQRRGRWAMVWVLLACAAPVIASYFTYYVIRPESRRVHGELIAAQPALPDVMAEDVLAPDGARVALPSLRGRWLLITVGDAACDAMCEQRLYWQRQLRESMGRDKDEVQRVWLIGDSAPLPQRLRAALEGATVLRVPQAQLAQWLQPAPGHALAEHLYVVDPMGHWMLRWPARMDAQNAALARRDLVRLLRARPVKP